jgi:putative nucleotidyltransferase with HDIG domain
MNQTVQFSPAQRLYFGVVIGAGLGITALSAVRLYLQPVSSEWVILAALALLTGSFTVRMTKLAIRVSVSDAFVFAAVLLFGTSPATLIVAVDSFLATVLMRRREHRSFFRSFYNLSVASLSLWTASTTFYWLIGSMPAQGELILTELLGPLFVLAGVYFLVNSWLIATVLSFEEKAPVAKLWWKHFPWFSLNYFGGVSAAALLVSYTRNVDVGAIAIILPLLVISYLTYRTSLAKVEDAQHHVEQLNELYMSTIETLAMAVDAKDQITHGHIRRVQAYAVQLATILGVTDEHQLRAIEAAALLHDMGKLAIPEHILNKPGKLTVAEFDKMKCHAAIGADLLSSVRFPYPVVPIVRHHHESWDGTGYPSKISGTDIPLGARILAVVDCFDALTSDRPYRPRLTPDEAFSIIRERRGSMYDPMVVDTFINSYAGIAPAAILAGQQARTLVPSFYGGDEGSERPLRDIRENAAQTSTLAEFARELDRTQGLSGALAVAAQYVRLLTPATICAFYRYAAETDSVVCTYAAGENAHVLIGLTIKNGERITGWVSANDKLIANSDATLDLREVAHQFDPSLAAAMAAPIIHKSRPFGVLTAYSAKELPFTDHHKYALERIVVCLTDRLASLIATSPATTLRFPSADSR